MRSEILRLEQIGKITNGQLIHSISFSLYRAEALCVITEDLDAKLYLLEILQGVSMHEHGTLYVNDRLARFYSPENALAAGLSYVTERQLIFSMDVAHNLYMTDPSFYTRSILNKQALHQSAQLLLEEFSLDYIRTSSLVRSLSEFHRYLLSILHAVASGARIIILDTPYRVYPPSEIKKLQHVINVLRQKGVSVLCFTNKWDALYQNFDRYAVIKNGVVTKLAPLESLPPMDFPHHRYQWRAADENSPVILVYEDPSHSSPLVLREGEILGIYGSNTLLEALISGLLSGDTVPVKNLLMYGKPYDMNLSRKNHIAFIYATEDKLRVFPQMNLFDNVTLLIDKPIYNLFGIRNKRIRNHIAASMLKSIHGEHLITEFGDKPNIKDIGSLDRLKVEIAKWLCVRPKVFIFVNPHNIYDNLTESDFHTLLDDLHTLGISILILSASEENLSGLCTRVISAE